MGLVNKVEYIIWKCFAGCVAGLPLGMRQRLARRDLVVIPFYHVVSDQDLPHIKHLYCYRNSTLLARDLDYYLAHYSVIDLHDLLAHYRQGRALPRNPLLLTFDDGFREDYEVAAPILKKKGVPATFFVCSAFVDNKDLFFRNKVSLLIDKMQSPQTSAASVGRVREMLAARGGAGGTIAEALRSVTYAERGVLDQVAQAVDLDFQAFLARQRPYLTTDQVRLLIKDGFTIGAHSVDHPLYGQLTLEQQVQQTLEGQAYLERQFALDYRVFAFPYEDQGVSRAFFEQVRLRGGPEITFGSAGMMADCVPGNLQRVCLANDLRPVGQILAQYYANQLFKVLIGKGCIARN